jgi:hypothetical protein
VATAKRVAGKAAGRVKRVATTVAKQAAEGAKYAAEMVGDAYGRIT